MPRTYLPAMEPWVTVAAFMLPSELAVARGMLESEGIECRTQDEFTVQVHNLYSQAIGGIKLQVAMEQAELAKALLRKGGILHDAPDPKEGMAWLRFVAWSDRVPVLRRLELPMARAMVLLALILLVVLVPIALASRPTVAELLVEGEWCVDRISHEGQEWVPNSTGFRMEMGCAESIDLFEGGSISLPGFDTPGHMASWRYDGRYLWMEGADDLPKLFEGPFTVGVNERHLTLRSTGTVIHCTRQRYGWSL